MTAPLEFSQRPEMVLPLDEWTTIAIADTDGVATRAIVTVVATVTPEAVCEIDLHSAALDTGAAAQLVDQIGVYRFGPIDIAADDFVEVRARRLSGSGGIVLLTVGGIQGTFPGEVDPGAPVTETAFTLHPFPISVTPGGQLVFTSHAVGSNVGYQWQVSTVDPPNPGTWANIPGEVDQQLTIVPTLGDHGNWYRSTASGDNDPGGLPVESNGAQLTVNVLATTLVRDLDDIGTVSGSSVTFEAEASGSNLTSTVSRRRGGNIDEILPAAAGAIRTFVISTTTDGLDGDEYQIEFVGDSGTVSTRWALLTVTSDSLTGPLLTDIQRGQ